MKLQDQVLKDNKFGNVKNRMFFKIKKVVINKCRFVFKSHKKRRKIIQLTSEKARNRFKGS